MGRRTCTNAHSPMSATDPTKHPPPSCANELTLRTLLPDEGLGCPHYTSEDKQIRPALGER